MSLTSESPLILDPSVLGLTLGNTQEIDVSEYSGITLQFRSGATLGGVITVEGLINAADPTTWQAVPFVRMDGTPTIGTGALTSLNATTNYRYRIDANGLTRLRLKITTALGSALTSLAAIKHIDTSPLITTIGSGVPISGTVNTAPTGGAGTQLAVATAVSTNASNQKATSANLFEVTVSNPTATPVYVKFYNKATSPTVGTDVPVLTIPAPATSVVSLQFGAVGKRLPTGLALAVTGAIAATDTTNAVAGVFIHGTYI